MIRRLFAAAMLLLPQTGLAQSSDVLSYDIGRDTTDDGYPQWVEDWSWPGVDALQYVTAALDWGNGKVYFFNHSAYVRFDRSAHRTDPGYPKPVSNRTWPGLGALSYGIDAAINWGNGKVFFFSGDQYIRYDIAHDRADPGYPKYVDESTWPMLSMLGTIDAAVNWGNGKAYFFGNGAYIRYDIAEGRPDPGYPKFVDAGTWPGVWSHGPNAVVNWGNGKAYFFAD